MAEVARGTTGDRPLARTLYAIAAKRFTGEFTLTAAAGEYRIAWHDGAIVAAAAPVGETLVDRAAAVFGAGDGTFVLDSDATLRPQPDGPVDVRRVIFAGLVTYADAAALERDTAPVAQQPFAPTPHGMAALDRFGFAPADQPWLRRIVEEPGPLADLLDADPTADHRRVRAIVAALLATDAVAPAGASPAGAAPESATADPHADLRALVTAKADAIARGADHFELLGIARDATAEQIRAAYFALAKQIHPDRVRQLGAADLAAAAGKVFARANEAFAVLGDDAKRAEYVAQLAAGGPAAEDAMLRVFEAEEKFRLGEMALKRGHYQQALADFDKAVELNPDEGEHHAMAAYARFMDAADKAAVFPQVARQFRRAIALAPNNANVFYFRGKVAKEVGDLDGAMYCFQRALALDKAHEPAFRERKALAERLAATQAADSPRRERARRGLLGALRR